MVCSGEGAGGSGLELGTEEMNYGLTTFKDFFSAFWSNFVIVSGDGWSRLLYLVSFFSL